MKACKETVDETQLSVIRIRGCDRWTKLGNEASVLRVGVGQTKTKDQADKITYPGHSQILTKTPSPRRWSATRHVVVGLTCSLAPSPSCSSTPALAPPPRHDTRLTGKQSVMRAGLGSPHAQTLSQFSKTPSPHHYSLNEEDAAVSCFGSLKFRISW